MEMKCALMELQVLRVVALLQKVRPGLLQLRADNVCRYGASTASSATAQPADLRSGQGSSRLRFRLWRPWRQLHCA